MSAHLRDAYQSTKILSYWGTCGRADGSFQCGHALKECITLNFSAAPDLTEKTCLIISLVRSMWQNHNFWIWVRLTHEIATELFSMIIRIDPNLGSYRVNSWGRGCTEMPASACILLWALCTSQPGFWSRIHVSPHILKVSHLVKNKYWCMYLQNHNPLHYGHANVFRSSQGSLSKRADG